MKVTVTQEHIDAGKRCSPGSCPIALALRNGSDNGIFNTGSYWSVGSTVASKHHDDARTEVYALPPEAVAFISAFDHGAWCGPAKPFEFELPDGPLP